MFLPGGNEFLEAVITDLGLVKPLGVSGELMQCINCAVSLFGDLFAGPFECLGHFAGVAENLFGVLKICGPSLLLVSGLNPESICLRLTKSPGAI